MKKNMNKLKLISIGLVIVVLLIQFIHPAKNISTEKTTSDITVVYTVPDSVLAVLKNSCYDCHSNNTKYPWYNNIQPVAWWLNNHIEEAKEEINFSEFGKYSIERQVKKLKKCAKEIEDDEMPIGSYTIIHGNAKLSKTERTLLMDWANNQAMKIQGNINNGIK